MPGIIDTRLAELGITLTDAPAPAANYVPYVISGDLVFISGQVPLVEGAFLTGKVGAEVSVEEAQATARVCGLALISQLRAACGGDLSKLARAVKLVGFVNSTPDFADQPRVINGASDLLAEILGDKGRHTRIAVGCSSLPLNAAVEIDAVFAID